MNYVRRTHNGLDYAKVEVYDEHGNTQEYEVNKHLADAINNMHGELKTLRKQNELDNKRFEANELK